MRDRNVKLRVIYILRLLSENFEKWWTVKELARQVHIELLFIQEPDRKTIYSDIRAIMEAGIQLEFKHTRHNLMHFRLAGSIIY